MSWLKDNASQFLKRVNEAQSLGIYPYFRQFQSIGSRVKIGGRQYINFTSNDYLGLSQDSRLIEAAKRAADRYGMGLGSSRVQATSDRHVELERRLARWFDYPACMVFTTGYQSLVGVLSTFAAPKTTIIMDQLSHASIIDGIRMAQGTFGEDLEVRSFRHNSIRGLERVLKSCTHDNKLIVIEGVYSLDGDIAPLDEMVALARQYNAAIVLDDAHGMGTIGARGRGVCEHFHVPRVDFLVGTFSKSFGGVGGFVLAEQELIDYLKGMARPFTFSASLPVPQVEAMIASLDILEHDLSHMQRLHHNQALMREGLLTLGFDLGTSNTHIMPLVLHEEKKTLEFGAWLYGLGVIMIPIFYPAVPLGEERLRCNITAAHSEQDIGITLEIVEYIGKKLGVLPHSAKNPNPRWKRATWIGQEAVKRVSDIQPKDFMTLGQALLHKVNSEWEEWFSGHPAELTGEDVMKLRQQFWKKNVVITGGSSGIGKSLAKILTGFGANLFLVARGREKLDETILELQQHRQFPEQVWQAVAVDISDRVAITQAMQELVQQHDIDILINNAGVAYANHIEETPPEIFEQMMDINYLGTVWTTLALIPHFKKRRRGHVVNMSSLAGVLGIFGYAAYSPSKFAVMGFSDVIRNELLPHNIQVTVVMPPDTDTPQLAQENQTKPEETKVISGKAKMLHPDDVALVTLKGMVRGQYHVVPGGMDSHVPYWGVRFIPGITRWVIDRDLMNFWKKKEQA